MSAGPAPTFFPQVVATFNFTGKTGTFSFQVLPGTLPTGDYQLNDVVTITTPDAGATVSLTFSCADDTGAVSFAPWGGASNPLGSAGVASGNFAGGCGTDERLHNHFSRCHRYPDHVYCYGER